MSKSTLIYVLASIVFCSVLGARIVAQDAGGNEQTVKPEPETQTKKVRVIDPEGKPIEGATVEVKHIRMEMMLDGRQLMFFRSNQIDDDNDLIAKSLTSADGVAEIVYTRSNLDWQTNTDPVSVVRAKSFELTASHPSFVDQSKDRVNFDQEIAEIQLDRGFRIAVSAVDGETGQRLTENLYAAIGADDVTWKTKNNGTLVSSPLEQKDRFLRVVELVEGKPARFSKRCEIKPGQKQRVLIKDVQVSAGTRVVGKLSDSVSRPVKKGYVIARIALDPEATVEEESSTHWQWNEAVKIEEDGTFVFESLPSDEVLQMISVCEGWVQAKPEIDSVAKFFPAVRLDQLAREGVVPQLVELKGKQVSVTLDMEPTHTMRVRVVRPQGAPIKGAKIKCLPLQNWYCGASDYVGTAYSQRDLLVKGLPSRIYWSNESTYCGRISTQLNTDTNHKGIVTLNNIPDVQSAKEFLVSHSDHELPNSPPRSRFSGDFEFDDSGVTEVTVKLGKKVEKAK